MKMKSRIIQNIISILLVTSPFILSGCSSNDTDNRQSGTAQQTTITFAATTGAVSEYEELITTFESQHLDIRVELLAMDGELPDYERLTSQVDTLVLGSVVSAENSHLFLDLTPLMSNEDFSPDDFWPNALQGCQSGEKQVGLPVSLSPNLVFYNKNIFNQKNVAYPQPSWRWNEFINTVQLLSGTSGTKPVYGFVDNSAGFILRPETHALLGTNKTPAEVGTTLDWYLELARTGEIAIPGVNIEEKTNDLVRGNQAAMWVGTLSGFSYDLQGLDFEVGFVPFPTSSRSEFGSNPVSVSCAVVSSGTGYPEASWTWLNFLSRNSVGISSGFPANLAAIEDSPEWVSQTLERQTAIRESLQGGWYGWVKYDFTPIAQAFQKSIQSGQRLADLLPTNLSLLVLERDIPEVEHTPQAVIAPEPTPLPKVEKAEDALSAVYYTDPDSYDNRTVLDLAEEFNRANPEYYIEIKTERGIDFADTNDFINKITSYDCFLSSADIVSYQLDDADQGESFLQNIYSLDPFLDSGRGAVLNDIDPIFLDTLRINGSLYGLPVSINPLFVYYNADLLQELGLEPPDLDWTVEDFWALAQQAALKKEGVYGYVPYLDWPNYFFSEAIYMKIENQTLKADYENPQLVDLLNQLIPLAKNKTIFVYDSGGTRSAMGNYMLRDELIRFEYGLLWLDGIGMSSIPPARDRNDFEIGIAVYPTQQVVDPSTTSTLYISRRAENPQVCWEWIKFLSQQPNNGFRGIPLKPSILDSENWVAAVGEERAAVYQATMSHLQFYHKETFIYTMPFNQWWIDAIVAILQDGQDTSTVLKETQFKAQATLDCMQSFGYSGPWSTTDAYETAIACAHEVDPDYYSMSELWSVHP
jgi:multiple sugar transport system substrate-binding protein